MNTLNLILAQQDGKAIALGVGAGLGSIGAGIGDPGVGDAARLGNERVNHE